MSDNPFRPSSLRRSRVRRVRAPNETDFHVRFSSVRDARTPTTTAFASLTMRRRRASVGIDSDVVV